MIQRILILIMIGVCQVSHVFACDACGCGISTHGTGLLLNYRISSISLSHLGARFEGNPDHGANAQDIFHISELSVRHYLSRRWKMLASIPYRSASRNDVDIYQNLSGIGDVRLQVGYTLLDNQPLNKSVNIYLESVIGVRAPTGLYNPDLHDEDLPENFNPGQGAWGLLEQNHLVISSGYWGFVLGSYVQLNSSSSKGYRFGNQIGGQVLAYWEKRLTGDFSLVPSLGLHFEHIGKDHYANANEVHSTGGQGLFLNAGGGLKYKNLQLNGSLYLPLQSHYSSSEVLPRSRYAIQFIYHFFKKIDNAK
ncbi:MAG: hypothetical protein IPL46_13310 [Saprospiraceae bacterium]|nr:hypothetical protein [Saprospiraceae bacterium]